MLRRYKAACLIALLVLNLCVAASAETPYESYIYGEQQMEYYAPLSYTGERLIYARDYGIGDFKSPQDIFVRDDYVYVADTGNSRIVVLDSDLNFSRVIDSLSDNGERLDFGEIKGLFVDKSGTMYIADSGLQAVLVADSDGNLIKKLTRPDSDIIPSSYEFKPAKVVVDSLGTVYVISYGMYRGAFLFGENGSFLGFYGANRVDVTPMVLISQFWKSILNQEQRDKMLRNVPIEYINFDIDPQNFVYTCSNNLQLTDQLKKLNPMGTNVLLKNGSTAAYGDVWTWGDNTFFVDVCIDDTGFIAGLDRTRGRIFIYDENAELIMVAGGKSGRTDQDFTFQSAVALDKLGENYLVLDETRNTITVLAPTEYASYVSQGMGLYNQGKYSEALEPWQEALNRNTNLELAYIGLGKAYEKLGDYPTAMDYYKSGFYVRGYSSAFKEYRTDFIRDNFTWFVLIALAVIILPIVNIIRKRKKGAHDIYKVNLTTGRYPMYCAFHPFGGYEDMKETKLYSAKIATVIVAALFAVTILTRTNTGFIMNPINITALINVPMIFVGSVGVFMLWVIVNWAVTTLIDGEGKFHEIYVASAYALIPYIALTLFVVIASNFITAEEVIFLQIVQVTAFLWSAVAMLNAVKAVHQFTVGKTVLSIIYTLLLILIVLIVALLLMSVFTTLQRFISTIVTELMIRK